MNQPGGAVALDVRHHRRLATSPLLARLRALEQHGHSRSWIVERQAELLLAEVGITEPRVPEQVIETIGLIHIRRWKGLPSSGMTSRDENGWLIVISADESEIRQRFTIFHLLGRIVADPMVDNAAARSSVNDSLDRGEQQASHFAACVLMPAAWIRHDWNHGLRDPRTLGRRYGVNPQGVRIRLAGLGLLDTDEEDRITEMPRHQASHDQGGTR